MSATGGDTTGQQPHGLNAAGRIVVDIQRRIFAGELAVGSPLREIELVGQHRTSRHTIREALRELV